MDPLVDVALDPSRTRDAGEVGGILLRGVRCPSCSARLTVPADWSAWPLLGVPAIRLDDVADAVRAHVPASPGCRPALDCLDDLRP